MCVMALIEPQQQTDTRLTDEQVQAIADLQYPNLNALASEVQDSRRLIAALIADGRLPADFVL